MLSFSYLVLGIEVHVRHLTILLAIVLFVEHSAAKEEQQAHRDNAQDCNQRHATN